MSSSFTFHPQCYQLQSKHTTHTTQSSRLCARQLRSPQGLVHRMGSRVSFQRDGSLLSLQTRSSQIQKVQSKSARWQVRAELDDDVADPGPESGASAPIVVIGARGKTGKKVITLAARGGGEVRAGAYGGNIDLGSFDLTTDEQEKVQVVKCDVKDASSLAEAVNGARGVIYAASASPGGGSALDIDRDGVISTAEACIAAGVSRLVIVSSGSVSKPLSPVYLFLNLFGGIMEAKIDGEDAVRALYRGAQLGGKTEVSYTIVRPGGLTEDSPVGVMKLGVNQGDDISGRISRWDVADICLNALISPSAANTTFECYNADTAQDLANVGFSNIMGNTNDGSRQQGSRERANKSSFEELFAGLIEDSGPQKGSPFEMLKLPFMS